MPLQNHKKKIEILCLCLQLMRILLGINFGLRLSTLDFGHHVLDGEVILRGVGLGGWLNSFILPFILWPRIPHNALFLLRDPCWNFSIQRRVLDDERLLREKMGKGNKRKGSNQIFSNVFWEIDILHPLQLGASRNSCSIECLRVHLGIVVPAYHRHLLGQPCLSPPPHVHRLLSPRP